MTCIVAIKKNGVVYMGADSAGVVGLSLLIRKDPKIYVVEDLIMGFTSSFRMGQLLGYQFKKPEHPAGILDHVYIATFFIEAVRKLFKDFGYSTIDNNSESGGHFLIGYRGEIYQVESDFQVGQVYEDFYAIGCGGELAMGSLYSTKKSTPIKRLEMALMAAQAFSTGVRAPFIFRQTVKTK